MKQTVLDVLVYLFENYLDADDEFSLDRETLRVELKEAGFDEQQVVRAFDWLQGLSEQRGNVNAQESQGNSLAIRIYSPLELAKLNTECRGFLQYLESVGALDHLRREMVIDRIMALEADEIDIEQVKWVVLMVLFNQLGQENDFIWMEHIVRGELHGSLH